MQKRIILQMDNARRRLPDNLVSAKQRRDTSVYGTIGGMFGGSGGVPGPWAGGEYEEYVGPDGRATCIPRSRGELVVLTADGFGGFINLSAQPIRNVYFDSLRADPSQYTGDDTAITPVETLLPGTEVSAEVE